MILNFDDQWPGGVVPPEILARRRNQGAGSLSVPTEEQVPDAEERPRDIDEELREAEERVRLITERRREMAERLRETGERLREAEQVAIDL